MKINLTFKTPDAMFYELREIEQRVRSDAENEDIMTKDDVEEIVQKALSDAKETAEMFIRNDEYISIELDTETKTCTVLRAK